ncbi:putative quinol monooxygenase [Micromonospora costi]|uniref:putative quinol monooxygenase n=1 Tax=Micromonospora costi TaxID=1530042 RepID=UPI003410A6E8
MSVTVVATMFPVPEHRAEVVAVLEKTIVDVHAHDDGCLLYALQEGDDRLVMIEKWSDAAALETHGKGPAIAELTRALSGKLTRPMDLQVLRPHPAGTPEQGQL